MSVDGVTVEHPEMTVITRLQAEAAGPHHSVADYVTTVRHGAGRNHLQQSHTMNDKMLYHYNYLIMASPAFQLLFLLVTTIASQM